MSEDRLQLRASDYKSDWATALAVDLKESAELARIMTILSDELGDQRDAVLDIVQLMPQLLVAIEDRLSATTSTLTMQIENTGFQVKDVLKETSSTLAQSQADFLAEFEAQRQDLARMRVALDTQRADIEGARRSLDEARSGFNQMGFFKRIFIRR